MFAEWEERIKTDPSEKVANCQILHYTRRCPTTGRISSRLRWVRTVSPSEFDASKPPAWRELERPVFTSAELVAFAQQEPQIINTQDALLLPPHDKKHTNSQLRKLAILTSPSSSELDQVQAVASWFARSPSPSPSSTPGSTPSTTPSISRSVSPVLIMSASSSIPDHQGDREAVVSIVQGSSSGSIPRRLLSPRTESLKTSDPPDHPVE